MKLKLVENWRKAYKWASVQLALVAATAAGILTGSQELAVGLLNLVPEGPWRLAASAGVFVVVLVVPTLTRVLEKKHDDTTEQ